jgi:hypothetical protein
VLEQVRADMELLLRRQLAPDKLAESIDLIGIKAG